MMNSSIERIPIQTLCGVISIHEVLPDLPLPSHLPTSTAVAPGLPVSQQQSLIHYPDTVNVAEQLLQMRIPSNNGRTNGEEAFDFEAKSFLESLTHLLISTNTDDLTLYTADDLMRRGKRIESSSSLVDNATGPLGQHANSDGTGANHVVDIAGLPPLFNRALRIGAEHLENKSAFQCFVNSLGNTSWPPPPAVMNNVGTAPAYQTLPNMESHPETHDQEANTSKSHKKKHKKKKSKKHHHDADDSTAAEAQQGHDSAVHPPDCEGYIGRLKIRLNPGAGPGAEQVFTVENSDHKEKKDKKKKKKKKNKEKDRDKEKKHKHKHHKNKENAPIQDNPLESLGSQAPQSSHIIPPMISPHQQQDFLPHDPNTNLFMVAPQQQANASVVDPLLQPGFPEALLPSLSPLPNMNFSPLPSQVSHHQGLPSHVPLDYHFQGGGRPRGLFDDVLKGDHGVLNGDEHFLHMSPPHQLLMNGQADLLVPSFPPPTTNEEETCRAGSLLQVINSGRAGSEYGQGRGKPDAFEAHTRRGAAASGSPANAKRAAARQNSEKDSSTPSRPRAKRPRNSEVAGLWCSVNYEKTNGGEDDEEGNKEAQWEKRLGTTAQEHWRSVRIKRRIKKPTRFQGMQSDYAGDEDEAIQAIDQMADSSSGSDDENATPRKRRRTNPQTVGEGGASDASPSEGEASYEDRNRADNGKRSKQRRKTAGDDDDEEYVVRMKDPLEGRYTHLMKSQERSKPRRERVSRTLDSMLLPPGLADSSGEGNTESAIAVKRFLHRVHQLFQRLDDPENGGTLDMRTLLTELQPQLDRCTLAMAAHANAAQKQQGGGSSGKRHHSAMYEPIHLDERVRIPRAALTEFTQEVAKLKALGLTNHVPLHKLQTLLLMLHLNMLEGSHLQPVLMPGLRGPQGKNAAPSAFEEEQAMWQEMAMDRVLRSTEASLSALLLMTSGDMPKEVFVEDIIDRSIFLLRNQLVNTIFQEFDPAYRVDESVKDLHTSIRTKRARERDPHTHKSRGMQTLYHRLVEMTSCLAQLVAIQPLTDTLVLQLSTVAVSVFFVENVADLQLMALKLLTNIFSQYENHRANILEEILASLDRLPSSKKNLRAFRLNSEESIQMFTALVLMLVQSVVRFPSSLPNDESSATAGQGKARGGDKEEVMITQTHTESMRTAYNFLLNFLKKSTQKQDDQDYRNTFENFVNDLLLTVNKPEWPVAEMLLSLLGSLLVQQFNNKNLDQATRVTSVDYLGTVASTLRRDAVSSQLREHDIDNIIRDLRGEGAEDAGMEEEKPVVRRPKTRSSRDNADNGDEAEDPAEAAQSARIQALSDALIVFLSQDYDATLEFSRRFYLAQWLSDCSKELESQGQKVSSSNDGEKANGLVSSMVRIEERKQHYLRLIYDEVAASMNRAQGRATLRHNRTSGAGKTHRRLLDYEEACLVCRYLASLRPFSQSFDLYITQICKLLNENSVAVRTKAMRCLSAVVEADPSVLARKDIERGVHSRFLDTSTSVREAAIELVGKYCLTQRSLVAQYYPLLAERILDKGISVRKRVIKIFRDICLEHPEFEKNTEICVKMIRRVNDEEGIKKLVNEVFQNMWFTPVRDRDNFKLLQKVVTITDVVASCQETSNDWFLQFLESLLNKEEKEKIRPVEKACKQIVESLVQHILRLEEISQQNNCRLVACLATLHLFTRAQPSLMVSYAHTLSPYLRVKCTEANDHLILHHATRILEIIVPLLEHPDKKFLTDIERALMDLMVKQGKLVLESAVACLSAVVNHCTHNFELVRQYFAKRYGGLLSFRPSIETSPDKRPDIASRPIIMRSVFLVGLLCKHFEFHLLKLNPQQQEELFNTLMFYTTEVSDADIRRTALSGLGFLCTRNIQLLCSKRVREFYAAILMAPPCTVPLVDSNGIPVSHPLLGVLAPLPDVKVQVMENLHSFLSEDERRIMSAESQWGERHLQESLKETDPKCSLASQVAQYYYQPVLNSFLHPTASVRSMALNLIVTILKQGLMNPVPIVSSLIALQTDWDSHIRNKADIQLQEIDNKYPCFINMRACEGILLSYELQRRLTDAAAAAATKAHLESESHARHHARGHHHHHQGKSAAAAAAAAAMASNTPPPQPVVVRGTRDPLADVPTALNEHLYSLLRANRNMRHALVSNLLKRFEETQLLTKSARSQTGGLGESSGDLASGGLRKLGGESGSVRVTLGELLYLCDNLAYFPYQSQEEPLYIIHHSDLIVSLAGHNILNTVRDVIFSDLVEQQQQQQILLLQQNGMEPAAAAAAVTMRTPMIDEEVMSEAAILERLGFSPASNSHPTGSLLINVKGHHMENNLTLVMRRRWILRECVEASRACFLLLMLKQFFKELYSVNDVKIQRYLPNENVKQWDKPLTRRPNVRFKPKHILQVLSEEQRLGSEEIAALESHVTIPCTPEQRRHFAGLVREYVEFRNIMLTIDPEDALHTGDPVTGDVTRGAAPSAADGAEERPAPSTARGHAQKLDPKFAPQVIPQDPVSSLEEDTSEDSELEGSSRLRLAKVAKKRRPAKKSTAPSSSAVVSGAKGAVTASPQRPRKKKPKKFKPILSSSESESQASSNDSHYSDPDFVG